MKLHAERLEGVNSISGYTADSVSINGAAWRSSVLVPWRGAVAAWAVAERVGALQPQHFEAVAALEPELVIFGSGQMLAFPPPLALRALMARRVGVETMTTPAACRTYNILVSEGRKVVAALWLDPGPAPAAA